MIAFGFGLFLWSLLVRPDGSGFFRPMVIVHHCYPITLTLAVTAKIFLFFCFYVSRLLTRPVDIRYPQTFLFLCFYLLLATIKLLKVEPITAGKILLIASFNLLMNSLPFITLPPQQISPVIASERIRSASFKVLRSDESEGVTG